VVTATRKLNPITNWAVGESRRKGEGGPPARRLALRLAEKFKRGRRLFIYVRTKSSSFQQRRRQAPPVACYLSREPAIHRPFPGKVEASAVAQPRSRDNRVRSRATP